MSSSPTSRKAKGGLRDLHALFWIGKYAYRVAAVADLVEAGLLTRAELRQFQRAERFLWAVRCHLHIVAGRAEERLTFDVQREIATRMRYADRPGKSSVERFMRHYFLHARSVGVLTGVFLAHLDDLFARRGRRFIFPSLRRRPRKLEGFMLDRGRLAVPDEAFLAADPVRLDPALRARRSLRPRRPSAGDARGDQSGRADRCRRCAPILAPTRSSSTC